MFQSSSNQPQRSLVTLHLVDGRKIIVSLKLSLAGKVSEVLNGTDMFLDVIGSDGQSYFLAKSQVVKVEATQLPKAGLNQQRRTSDKAQFNPYAVLGVSAAAPKDEVQARYHELSRIYHPDRYINLDLPQEMKDYAAAMQARINLAYEQVEKR